MRRLRVTSGLVVLALLSGARPSPTRAADEPANAVSGAARACGACHGADGVSPSPATPNLAGQKAAYLAAQLAAFKSKDRKNDLMNAIAGQLSDDDIKALARYWSSLPAAAASAVAQAPARPAIASRMTFPAGFPQGFTAYQTLEGDGFVTKRYANAVAVRAARAGKPLPDGSVILQVTYDATRNAAGALAPGAVKSYAGMESHAGWGASVPALLRNEDWDFAQFNADKSRRDNLNEAPCLACHKPAVADSYVFSSKVLREAVTKPGA